MSNPFDDLTYFIVDYSSIPSGWSHQERRDSRKRVNRSVGLQSNVQPHLKTEHRKDAPTLFDAEGALIQTADKALFHTSNLTDQEIVDNTIAEIADELNKTIQAVTQKIEITILGNQQDMLNYLAANKENWGE